MRGYFGIGIEAGKTPQNFGALARSAHAFGAAFVFTLGYRYPKQRADTTRAYRHVPAFELNGPPDLATLIAADCKLVAVEIVDGARPLPSFCHPERAVYVLGAEDHGVSCDVLDICDATVEVPTAYCLNVATTGALVMYDRIARSEASTEHEHPPVGVPRGEVA